MIDLSKAGKTRIYPIKLDDGTILHIKQPTEKVLIEIMNINEYMEQNQDYGVEIIEDLYGLLTTIFNNNTDKKEFDKDGIEQMMNINIAVKVLQDYIENTFKILGE